MDAAYCRIKSFTKYILDPIRDEELNVWVYVFRNVLTFHTLSYVITLISIFKIPRILKLAHKIIDCLQHYRWLEFTLKEHPNDIIATFSHKQHDTKFYQTEFNNRNICCQFNRIISFKWWNNHSENPTKFYCTNDKSQNFQNGLIKYFLRVCGLTTFNAMTTFSHWPHNVCFNTVLDRATTTHCLQIE